MRIERVVLDTNVLISAALLSSNKPFAVFQQVLDSGILIFSNETFEEIATRLVRPKFERYVSKSTRERFLADISAVAEWTAITGALHCCRDPDDDKIVETALAGRASCLVTGDADLLDLHPFRSLSILTPHQFLEARP